jgi:hypothetical protein
VRLAPSKTAVVKKPKRCKPEGMRIDEPRQQTKWAREASLRPRLEPGCSTKMMMMMIAYHLTLLPEANFNIIIFKLSEV